jgi:antitoxin FitA
LTVKPLRLQIRVMAVLTIRDVPEDVKDALARDARERGQSLQAFLLGILKRQAAFGHNRQLLDDIERDLAAGRGAGADAPDAAELLKWRGPIPFATMPHDSGSTQGYVKFTLCCDM